MPDLANWFFPEAVDAGIASLLNAYRHPAMVRLFFFISLLGKAETVLCFASVTTVFLWKWLERTLILPLWIGISGSYLSAYLLKISIHRQRPSGIGDYTEFSYSFPSLHATIAVFLFGFIAYILVRRTEKRNVRLFILFAAVVLMIAIGFSRLYLGVHFLSDVLGGYLLGALWLAVGVRLAKYPPGKKRRS